MSVKRQIGYVLFEYTYLYSDDEYDYYGDDFRHITKVKQDDTDFMGTHVRFTERVLGTKKVPIQWFREFKKLASKAFNGAIEFVELI